MTNNDVLRLSYLDGDRITSWAGSITLKHFDVGTISLPTGSIHALDPLVFLDTRETFEITVAPGTYPVRLSIAQLPDDQRVAFAMILFSEHEASDWQMALLPGQDESVLGEDEVFGYPVDSGTGCFMDEAGADLLRYEFERDDTYFERLTDEMDKTYVPTWSYLNKRLPDNCNLVAFSSGLGDGLYASYFGFAETSAPVCLVTDFGLADPP